MSLLIYLIIFLASSLLCLGFSTALLLLSRRRSGKGVLYCLLAVISYALSLGSPVACLGVLFSVPLVVQGIAARTKKGPKPSPLPLLYALRGLLRAGIGLPSAIFQLSREDPSSLANPFETFLKFANHKTIFPWVSLLEMSYRNGLPISPLLDRMIPILETERRNNEKIRHLQRSTGMQIVIACLVPWFIGGAIYLSQPEGFTSFRNSPYFYGTVGIAILIELTGGFILWKVSAYY